MADAAGVADEVVAQSLAHPLPEPDRIWLLPGGDPVAVRRVFDGVADGALAYTVPGPVHTDLRDDSQPTPFAGAVTELAESARHAKRA